MFDFPETAPFNQIFNRAGYNTTTYIIELGTIFHITVGFAILVPIREIFKRVMKKRETSNRFLQYLKGKSDKMIYKVIIIRFLLEGCIELGLSAMITVIILVKSIGESKPLQPDGRRSLSQGRWTNFEIMSNTCAVLTLIGLLVSLWWLNRAARKYFTRRDERTEKKYGKLFADLSRDSLPQLNYSLVFLLRRFMMVLVLTLLPTERNIQINI